MEKKRERRSPLANFHKGLQKSVKAELAVDVDGKVFLRDIMLILKDPIITHESTSEAMIWACAVKDMKDKIIGLLP